MDYLWRKAIWLLVFTLIPLALIMLYVTCSWPGQLPSHAQAALVAAVATCYASIVGASLKWFFDEAKLRSSFYHELASTMLRTIHKYTERFYAPLIVASTYLGNVLEEALSRRRSVDELGLKLCHALQAFFAAYWRLWSQGGMFLFLSSEREEEVVEALWRVWKRVRELLSDEEVYTLIDQARGPLTLTKLSSRIKEDERMGRIVDKLSAAISEEEQGSLRSLLSDVAAFLRSIQLGIEEAYGIWYRFAQSLPKPEFEEAST